MFRRELRKTVDRPLNTARVGALLLATAFGNAPLLGAPIAAGEAAGEQSQADRTPPHVRAATTALRQGDQEKSLEILRNATSDDPAASPAEVQLANLLAAEGHTDEARLRLERAVVALSDDPEPHLMLGDLAWRERRLSDANLQYQRGGDLAGELPDGSPRRPKLLVWSLAGLGSVAEVRGQLNEAVGLYQRVLELQPGHRQANLRLAQANFSLGRQEKAYDHFRSITETSPGAPPAELLMANLARGAGDIDQAEGWLERAIEQSPKNASVRVAMARLLLDARHDADAAERHAEAALEIEAGLVEARQLLALAAWSRGDLEAAETQLEALALAAPGDATLNTQLAAVLAERGGAARLNRAAELATLVASSNPKLPSAAAAYGWVILQAGQTDKAVRQLQAAVEADGADRDARYYLARALFHTSQPHAATEQLEAALRADGPFVHLAEARRWGERLGLVD